MWFFEVKYGNNRTLGGHFYSREEMFEWFNNMLKYYTFHDEFYDLRIWEDGKRKDTICGKPIEEVITILQALDLERITGIKMCMENLAMYKDLLDKEMEEIIKRSFKESLNNLLNLEDTNN